MSNLAALPPAVQPGVTRPLPPGKGATAKGADQSSHALEGK